MSIDIPEPVAAFIDLVNRHDREGFLNAFTETGFVDDWGRVFTGRDAIDDWSQKEFIGASGVLTPEQTSRQGEEVTVIGDWRSTYANGRSTFTFRIAGDKLESMTIREG
ncbi:nuclear transport factor 2 family protein [Arthrobacter castelli]|uniref:nuclear transport factor 2 family protein n=1 Tax=Arthrobacter castelli TaxID=271431 RepID=UPI00040E2A38|nr:nuclear transport factor 2 family protein [Arthrobacter castelli]